MGDNLSAALVTLIHTNLALGGWHSFWAQRPKLTALVHLCLSGITSCLCHSVFSPFRAVTGTCAHKHRYTKCIFIFTHKCSIENNVILTHYHWTNNWMWNVVIYRNTLSHWVTAVEFELLSFSNVCWGSIEQFVLCWGGTFSLSTVRNNNCYSLALLLRI